jgi:hypothetical protein
MSSRDRQRAVTTSTSEREVLESFLDDLRDTILWKQEGLTREQALRSLVPSGTSLLGIVKHLAFVERYWFQDRFAGRDVSFPWSEQDPDADWRVEEWESPEGVADFYRSEIAQSRAVQADALGPDAPSARGKPVSLRWVLVHMIEETARHAGHADLLREAADGATGE